MKLQGLVILSVLHLLGFAPFSSAQTKLGVQPLNTRAAQISLESKKGVSALPAKSFENSAAQFKNLDTPKTSLSQKETKDGGVIGTGGGNGVAQANGEVIPLELYISRKVAPAIPAQDFKKGFAAFQEEVEKVRKVIPIFAKDITVLFSKIEWLASEIDLDNKSCLNNVGSYNVNVDGKQVILACQSPVYKVKLNMKYIRRLQKKEFLGVLFFHEAVVSKLLELQPDANEYRALEEKFVTEIHPYILGNQTLNPQKLYFYTQDLHLTDKSLCNPYAVEVDSNLRAECDLVKKKAQEDRPVIQLGTPTSERAALTVTSPNGTDSTTGKYCAFNFDSGKTFSEQDISDTECGELGETLWVKSGNYVIFYFNRGGSDATSALISLKPREIKKITLKEITIPAVEGLKGYASIYYNYEQSLPELLRAEAIYRFRAIATPDQSDYQKRIERMRENLKNNPFLYSHSATDAEVVLREKGSVALQRSFGVKGIWQAGVLFNGPIYNKVIGQKILLFPGDYQIFWNVDGRVPKMVPFTVPK